MPYPCFFHFVGSTAAKLLKFDIPTCPDGSGPCSFKKGTNVTLNVQLTPSTSGFYIFLISFRQWGISFHVCRSIPLCHLWAISRTKVQKFVFFLFSYSWYCTRTYEYLFTINLTLITSCEMTPWVDQHT